MIRKISIKEQVYEELKKKILAGDYRSGDELIITHITSEMGISNTPVREAISQLLSEGLVESTHNSKYNVVRITEENMQELNRAATAMMMAGYRLCLNMGITDELKKRLHTIYETQLKIKGTRDTYKYVSTAMSFDESFIRATNNKYLIDALNQLTTMLALSTACIDSSLRKNNIGEHKLILDAVDADDTEQVEAAIMKHFDKHVDPIH